MSIWRSNLKDHNYVRAQQRIVSLALTRLILLDIQAIFCNPFDELNDVPEEYIFASLMRLGQAGFTDAPLLLVAGSEKICVHIEYLVMRVPAFRRLIGTPMSENSIIPAPQIPFPELWKNIIAWVYTNELHQHPYDPSCAKVLECINALGGSIDGLRLSTSLRVISCSLTSDGIRNNDRTGGSQQIEEVLRAGKQSLESFILSGNRNLNTTFTFLQCANYGCRILQTLGSDRSNFSIDPSELSKLGKAYSAFWKELERRLPVSKGLRTIQCSAKDLVNVKVGCP